MRMTCLRDYVQLKVILETKEYDKIAYSSLGYDGKEIDIVRFNSLYADDDWAVNFHQHIFYELHYVVEGTAFTKFKDCLMEITQGNYYIMKPGVIHAHYQQPGTYHKAYSMSWGMKSNNANDSIFKGLKSESPEKKNDNGNILCEIKNFVQEYKDNQPKEILKLDILRIILKLSEEFDDIKTHCRTKKIEKSIVDEALVFMNQNIEKNMKATDIADAVHISYAHLSRLFAKVLNSSVKKTYRNLKIEKAKEMLCQTDDTVESIASASGFSNLNYFYEVFRRKTGKTPSELRKSKHTIKTE